MSTGYCGYADKVAEDEGMVIYSYCCYNLNTDDWREAKKKEDGEIYLCRDSFIEPEVRENKGRMSSRRKKRELKRIPKFVWPGDLIKEGRLTIKNASGTWMTNDEDVDIMAFRLVMKLITEYQLTGSIPQHVFWFS